MSSNNIILDDIPLFIKNDCSFNNLFTQKSCNVSVIWCVYDIKRKIIVAKGSSRPCGFNHTKSSIHAEEQAIQYCRGNAKRNHRIFIWRYSKGGSIKPKYCCTLCTMIANKYNLQTKIFTFQNNGVCPAIIDDPPLSLANLMK